MEKKKKERKKENLNKIRFLGSIAAPIAVQVETQLISGLVEKIFGSRKKGRLEFRGCYTRLKKHFGKKKSCPYLVVDFSMQNMKELRQQIFHQMSTYKKHIIKE